MTAGKKGQPTFLVPRKQKGKVQKCRIRDFDSLRGRSGGIKKMAAAVPRSPSARELLRLRREVSFLSASGEPAPPLATTAPATRIHHDSSAVADQLLMHTLSRCPRQLRIHDGRKHLPPSFMVQEKDSCPLHIEIPKPSACRIGAYAEELSYELPLLVLKT